jgi:hypothetical protein
MENNLYPPAPAGVDPADISPAFRKQVGVVITSIVLFAFGYLHERRSAPLGARLFISSAHFLIYIW